ncbi:SDR family oxidoreductase [Kitasatospora sp. NPDC001175]|uniref:SDR family oxidoreductase n=1 Tax=Kitasatospora sp. NPDC001175 TaxID=3157103 RepID=UPI003CFF41B5
MTLRWLITGCSSGLGLALARAAADAGHRVLATARRPSALDPLAAAHPARVVAARLDVRDADQCAAAVRLAVDGFGGLDVLVNNAGCGLFGTVEETSDEELRDQLEALVVGPWRLARLVMPLMRAQGSGHILNVSSIAGRTGFPGLAGYITAKHALEGLTQALATEAAPFGIRVTALEPGPFTTSFGAKAAETRARIPAYEEITRQTREGVQGLADDPSLGRPAEFAELVLRVVAAPPADTPVRIPVGGPAHATIAAVEDAARQELRQARALSTT